MQTRTDQDLTSPHQHPNSIVNRYLEGLMRLTYENPLLMRNLIKVVGITSLSLLAAAPVLSTFLGMDIPVSATIVATVIGTAGAVVSGGSMFAQHKLFGFPVEENQQVYKQKQFISDMAKGELILDDKNMPTLRIEANNHFHAGYVEGYMLADAIKVNLEHVSFLYPLMCAFMKAPVSNSGLKAALADILKTIPQAYLEEMHGKVKGYNAWLGEKHPTLKKLSFEQYLLLQLLPDIRNYNPFQQLGWSSRIMPPFNASFACTTIALRLNGYTIITRVLDWPSHNAAGKYFLQIDRKIAGMKRTIDIAIPVLTGALTVLNEDGLLIEMNIAPGEKIAKPEGMPAVLFNRYCAENASCVSDIERLVANEKPLSAYHLTASDGDKTKSFHFYQNPNIQGTHATEALDDNRQSPQLLVVANHGLQFEGSEAKVINHRDSDERKKNIHHLFNRPEMQTKFTSYINKQELSREDMRELKEICLQIARLPLVNNCESVLCAIYIYHHRQLIDASVATDNLYAQEKELDKFRRVGF